MAMIFWLKRGSLLLTALLILWLGLLWTDWLPPLSEAQRAALVLMREPRERAIGERNAFELFWLLPYEVPEHERAAVMAEDIARIDALLPGQTASVASVASERYPRRWPKATPSLAVCSDGGTCLDEVRSDPDAVRADLALRATALQELQRLSAYDHLRVPHRPAMAAPFPEYGGIAQAQLAAAALDFVEGRAEQALAGLCRDTAAWRQLKGRSDSLVFEMVNLAWLQQGAALYAQMRAELPLTRPLPEACALAFGPPRLEQRQSCDVYRSEFELLSAAIHPATIAADRQGDLPEGLQRAGIDLLINHEATAALSAEKFARICLALGQPASTWPKRVPDGEAQWQQCGWADRAFNPVGCILAAIATPTYSDYGLRDRDHEGRLQLLALAEWLAQQPDPAAAFSARPERFQTFEQPVFFEQGQLAIELLKPRQKEPPRWSIPLPGSRVVATSLPEQP